MIGADKSQLQGSAESGNNRTPGGGGGNSDGSIITLIALVMKYYTTSLEQTLTMSAYQFFCLLDEMQYMEDPKKQRNKIGISKTSIKNLESNRDFEEFFFG